MMDLHDDTPEGMAAAWYTRLRSGEMTAAEHLELANWRLAGPANAAAWAQVESIWQAMDTIGDAPAVLAMRAAARAPMPDHRSIRWGRYAGVAATAGLVVAISATLLPRLAPPATEIAYAQPREIITSAGQRSHVALPDGSMLIVAPQSRVRLGPWDSERRVTLLQGEAHFDVAHAPRRFVIHAAGASVTAIGTAFTVARDGTNVRTVLERGRIRVSADGGQNESVFVDPGHAVTIANGRIVGTKAVDADEEGSWTHGELVFAGAPLAEAVARYNRYAARPIRILGSGVAKMPITGRFRIGGKSGFVDMISAAGIVRVVRDDPQGIVLAAPKK
ncbi:FecR family protein [Sphingomonas sp. GB1N7]|uniref:FecR family protein n=1 Tax=Parasphingomonas caseinilytica TaxID=3096158 RepID=UPI002FCC931A